MASFKCPAKRLPTKLGSKEGERGQHPQVEAKRYITDYFLRMTGAEPVTREPRDAMCPSIQLSVQSGLSIILGSPIAPSFTCLLAVMCGNQASMFRNNQDSFACLFHVSRDLNYRVPPTTARRQLENGRREHADQGRRELMLNGGRRRRRTQTEATAGDRGGARVVASGSGPA